MKSAEFRDGAPGLRNAPKGVMLRASDRTDPARIASPWDATPLRARCVEPEGDPTEVIPADLLLGLLAEAAQNQGAEESVPRFEVVELEEPEPIAVDESDFEPASEETAGTEGCTPGPELARF
jgi:hypothetical protein